MNKIILLLLLMSATFISCSKNKCEGCEISISTYLDGELLSRNVIAADCGATPGTTVKRSPAAFGKEYTIIQTTKCW